MQRVYLEWIAWRNPDPLATVYMHLFFVLELGSRLLELMKWPCKKFLDKGYAIHNKI